MITGAASGLGYKYAEILLRNSARSIVVIDLLTTNGQNAEVTLEKRIWERPCHLHCLRRNEG